jgi:hypothetical protein
MLICQGSHGCVQADMSICCCCCYCCRWVQLPAVDEAGSGPCERMCHSMTPLPDGRTLLLGGRQKEGICKDMWWLDAVSGTNMDTA